MQNDPKRVREDEVTEMQRQIRDMAIEIKELKSTVVTHKQILWFFMAACLALIGAFAHPLGK